VVHIVVTGDIVDHSFLCLTEEWLILLWLVIMLTITVICLTDEWFILLRLVYC
jgi:hypothetical protein